MKTRVLRSCGIIAGVLVALVVAACGSSSGGSGGASGGGSAGSGANQSTVHASFPVKVTASFPSAQHLAAKTRLVISVQNVGHRALPDVAVTICNTSCAPSVKDNHSTSAEAFGQDVSGTDLATRSRPVWIVDRAPGRCRFQCDNPGGQSGSGVTANSNTWALGRLAPGKTARFSWSVTPVSAGPQVVAWQVAGDLTGASKATAATGGIPRGRFKVTIGSAPPKTHVTPTGKVVTTSGT